MSKERAQIVIGGGLNGRKDAYGQAVTEGMVDPAEVDQETFFNSRDITGLYEVLGLKTIDAWWQDNLSEPRGFGVARLAQAGLFNEQDTKKVERAIEDLRGEVFRWYEVVTKRRQANRS